MLKKILMTGLILVSTSAMAACPEADRIAASQGLKNALPLYEACALSQNDDASQLLLAKAYEDGAQGVPKNTEKMLVFYHLSADNGNAESQTRLAQKLLTFDETDQGRKVLQAYLNKVQTALKGRPADEFRGELLHPYTLLLLAAENASQKWYYPTDVVSYGDASVALKNYKIDDAKKKQALRDASAWKQKKMMQAAKEVLSDEDYKAFKNTVAPERGQADKFLRSRALTDFQKKVTEYKGN